MPLPYCRLLLRVLEALHICVALFVVLAWWFFNDVRRERHDNA